MEIQQIVITIISAISLSLLSGFVILKRQSLIGDAFSHIALPGIALALSLKIDIFWGALIFLLLGTFLIIAIREKIKIFLEAVVGFIFLLFLSLGKIFIEDEELIESLFGNIQKATTLDLGIAIIVCSFIIFTILKFKDKLAIISFSEEFAQAEGINVKKIDFIFLLMIAMAIALGIRVTGVLLVGSYLILPGLSCLLITKSFNRFLLLSGFYGIISSCLGIFLSRFIELGPAIVISQSLIFIIFFILKSFKL